MGVFKRIVAFFASFAIVLSFYPAAQAADVVYRSDVDFWTWAGNHSFFPVAKIIEAAFNDSFCHKSDSGQHYAESYLSEFFTSEDGEILLRYDCICEYCGEVFEATSEALYDAESDYLSTLDSTTATSPSEFATISFNTSIANAEVQGSLANYAKVSSVSGNSVTLLGLATVGNDSNYPSLYIECKPFTWGYLSGRYTVNTSCFPWDLSFYRSSYGLYAYYGAELYCVNTDSSTVLRNPYPYGFKVPDDTSQAASWSNSSISLINGYTYCLRFSVSPAVSYLYQNYKTFSVNSFSVDGVYVGDTGIAQPDPSTRTDSLMQALDVYNTSNSYVDNSTTINYFIGSVGSDGSVTDTYSPALYDEETLIFTEPVTGNQYQTKGWTYDYTSRSYYMTLDSGTMYIDGTEVTAVYLVYGDDNVEISYLSGSGATELIRTDTFAYVMVSQSACNINGHTNTVATTKEPTCTAAGERIYTCSVCGNQTVEAIPKLEHTYADYSIQQEPTCTNKGIAANTCTTCGGQITELLDSLGHDWLPTSITDESWAMPDGVRCPECHGTSFSHTRSDYEIVTASSNLLDPNDIFKGFLNINSQDGYTGPLPPTLNTSGTSGDIYRSIIMDLPAGTYTVQFGTTVSMVRLYFDQQGSVFSHTGTAYTFTAATDGVFAFSYRLPMGSAVPWDDAINVWLTAGTELHEYEPYIETEVEIIPPIYNFTCSGSDCSTEWTAEAVYQHAYTTYTCCRCGETMIQSEEPPMEEQDWFTGFGEIFAGLGKKAWEAISSGIGKVFGGFVDLLGGIFGFFSDTVVGGIKSFFSTLSDDSILGYYQDDTGTVTLPEGMSTAMAVIPALFGGLPAELQAPVIFGIAALFLIAALKLFL